MQNLETALTRYSHYDAGRRTAMVIICMEPQDIYQPSWLYFRLFPRDFSTG